MYSRTIGKHIEIVIIMKLYEKMSMYSTILHIENNNLNGIIFVNISFAFWIFNFKRENNWEYNRYTVAYYIHTIIYIIRLFRDYLNRFETFYDFKAV